MLTVKYLVEISGAVQHFGRTRDRNRLSGCTTTQPQHTWPSVIFCRRSYRLEFVSGRAPRSRLYRKHFQAVAEDISFCAALVWTAR